MKPVYLTPGPSELYFTVQDHVRKAMLDGIGSISHRSAPFKSIYKEADQNLRELLSIPEEFAIVFCSSATEIWERLLQNQSPSNPLFCVNGAFSQKFEDCANSMGLNYSSFESKENSWDWDEMNQKDLDFIAIAQNETSIGMATPPAEISQLRSQFPDAFLAVDMVSGLPYYQPDWNNWDSVYFSVQKGFGLPAGLGVWIIRRSKAKTNPNNSPHRQMDKMIEAADKQQNLETPNVLGIYLLSKVCEDMLRRGLDVIRRETDYKSVLTYQAIEQSSFLKAHISEEKYRSKTCIVAEVLKGNSQAIIDNLLKSGMQIGSGYGKFSENQIRIANFPTHSKEVFEKLVDTLAVFK